MLLSHFISATRSSQRRPQSQRGIVLIVALIVLVVMALVGIGMMRQTTSGVSIASNVAFRQNALSAGDLGTNDAFGWIQTEFLPVNGNGMALNFDVAHGYYATWGSNIDADPIQLFNDPTITPYLDTLADPTGNKIYYVIQRLCASSGPSDAIGQQCSVNDQAAPNGSKGGNYANYGNAGNTNVPPPLYRISAMVIGPKNSVAYTQVIVE